MTCPFILILQPSTIQKASSHHVLIQCSQAVLCNKQLHHLSNVLEMENLNQCMPKHNIPSNWNQFPATYIRLYIHVQVPWTLYWQMQKMQPALRIGFKRQNNYPAKCYPSLIRLTVTYSSSEPDVFLLRQI